MNEDRWKYIPEGTINIDFSGCRYASEIHEKLKESFGFPEYYGKNWSAFWDCLRDFAISEELGRTVIIEGLDQLPDGLKDYIEKMLEIMQRAENKYPLIHFEVKNS